tara:strand:- start:544 stop:654 length:111 start_codon:yes stop_codon:yes gene_type:complete
MTVSMDVIINDITIIKKKENNLSVFGGLFETKLSKP